MTSTTASVPVRPADPTAPPPRTGVLLALLAMMSMSFVLVTAEFLPGGLLPAMAADLGVTPGQAGQTVTVTAVVGFLVAPTIGILVPRLDRRTLLVGLALAAAVSNVVVAIAPELWMLLIARFLLGAALSGFWAMSLTVAAHVGGTAHLGRSMMLLNTGTTMATVLGVPLGVLLSAVLDWRTVFAGAAVLTLIVALLLRAVLPPVPAASSPTVATLWDTLRRRGIRLGLGGHVVLLVGHFAAYAFIRMGLERIPGLDEAGAATLLLVYGVGGFVGNIGLGLVADRMLPVLRIAVPLLIGLSVLVLAVWPGALWAAVLATGLWGFAFGGWLVVINTWAARQVPDRLEAGGGLVVAGFQIAIAVGAAVGGLMIDQVGAFGTFIAAGLAVLVGGTLFALAPAPDRR